MVVIYWIVDMKVTHCTMHMCELKMYIYSDLCYQVPNNDKEFLTHASTQKSYR